jgi:hypothetical protein
MAGLEKPYELYNIVDYALLSLFIHISLQGVLGATPYSFFVHFRLRVFLIACSFVVIGNSSDL